MINLECIDFAKNGRFYEDEYGNYYPSVTTKLGRVTATGEGLLRWYAKQDSYEDAQEYMEKRGTQGTNVHEACEQLLYGQEIDTEALDKKSIQQIQGFVNFWKKFEPTVHNTEFVVCSEELIFAGRIDLLMSIPGEDCEYALVDIKTSKGIYKKHKLQLMFYLYALAEMDELDPARTNLYVLLLKDRTKKGYQLKQIPYYPELVKWKNKEYNHDLYRDCDMEPKFKDPLPERLKLEPEEKVQELNLAESEEEDE